MLFSHRVLACVQQALSLIPAPWGWGGEGEREREKPAGSFSALQEELFDENKSQKVLKTAFSIVLIFDLSRGASPVI